MPIIKSAIKKLRKDRKRTRMNRAKKENLKETIKKAQKSKTAENVRVAASVIDKAVKTHLLHKNKAARLKSQLAKLVASKAAPKTAIKKTTEKSKAKKQTTVEAPQAL